MPGLGPFTGIGWCNGHAWTFVAGNAGDQVDLYVETLCGDGRSYLFEDACVPMDVRTEVYPTKATLPVPSPPQVHTQTIYSTVHGPVFSFDDAAERAYVFKRAQAGRFARSYEGLMGLNFGQSLDEVTAKLADVTATYNALYADDDGNIAYWFTGMQPVRYASIDHRLPTPGTGGFEWQHDTLTPAEMPHVVNPAGGVLHVNQGIDSKPISWWPRASGIFVGRAGHTRADQEFFEGAAPLDIAAVKAANREIVSDRDLVTPQLHQLIQAGLAPAAPGTSLGGAKALYDDWRAAGYPRVDADGDGALDHPAITVFGADYLNFPRSPVWDRWMGKVWSELGRTPPTSYVGRLGQTLAAVEDPALFSHAWADGWPGEFLEALEETLAQLEAEFGTPDMDEWLRDVPRTEFTAVGVFAPDPMPVQDHGSYSQIVDLGRHEGVNVLPPGNGRADRALDVLVQGFTGTFPPHFADQVDLYVNWAFKPMKMRPAQFTADPESVEVLVYPGRPRT